MPNSVAEVTIYKDRGIIVVKEADVNSDYHPVLVAPYPIPLIGKAVNIVAISELYDLNLSLDGETPIDVQVIVGENNDNTTFNNPLTFRDDFLSFVSSF